MVPLVKLLAQQTASTGVTGRCFDVMTWNMEHGFGGQDAWADPEAEAGIEEALRLAARCGAWCVAGRGPYGNQLTAADLER